MKKSSVKNILNVFKKYPESLVVLYFIFVTSLLAYSLNFAIVPDEGVHLTAIEFYSRATPDPFIETQTDTFSAGDLTRLGSYFYYYLMGFVYNLMEWVGINPLIPIRLLSVLASSGTLIYLAKIGRNLGVHIKVNTVVIFIIANIPMFLFLSAGVNYDPLLIMIASIVAYNILVISKNYSLKRSIFSLSLLGLGPIIKIAFAPLSLVAAVVLVWLSVINLSKRNTIKKITKQRFIQKGTIGWIILLAFFCFSIFLFTERYVQNYLTYNAINLKCDDVHSADLCQENFVFRRSQIYKSANLESPEVRNITYIPTWWSLMNERTYGILAHKSFNNNKLATDITLLLSIFLILFFIRRFRASSFSLYLLASFLLYVAILISGNINNYKTSQEIGLAVQGRYLFPVTLPILVYIVSLYSKELKRLLHSKYAHAISFAVILTVLWMGPYNLKKGMTSEWTRDDKQIIKLLFE